MGNALRLGISRIGLAWTKWRMKTKIKRKSISILILGLQASGKTTIALRLWKFKRELPDTLYVQTKGFNTYTIKRKNKSTINLYDLGGHSSIQELWEHYYADAHGVIFVIDVSDRSLISEAGEIFSKVLHDKRIQGKPVLLLANKHDLNESATDVELDSAMHLQEVCNSVKCLTRLEESTATDLKNDKGIFDGFRWLISYIENNYLELNDRVIHDTLVEQNEEKVRRAAAKELIGCILSSPEKTDSVEKLFQPRPLSQRSQRSLRYVRTESSTDLMTNEETLFADPHNLNQNEMIERLAGQPLTNYLIKSRPSSSKCSNEEAHPNPFLVERNVSTAPVTGRESRASGHSGTRSGTKSRPNFQEESYSKESTNKDDTKTPNNRTLSSMSKALSNDDKGILVENSNLNQNSSAVGRLSPEGADSDEGIVNPAFDLLTEQQSHAPMTTIGIAPTTVVKSSQIPDVYSPPDRIGKLVHTESSDTERASEITMVTTLVQVHEDQISKDRRGSTTSTHDSVAISLSSLKSEETDEWRDESRETPPTSATTNATSTIISTAGGGITTTTSSSSRLPFLEKGDKGKVRKFGVRGGRNKTGPLPPPGIISISTVQSGLSLQSPNHGSSRFSGTSSSSTGPRRKSRESVPGSGNSKLKKKSLSGFPDSRESQSESQQFVRELREEVTVTSSSQMERLKKY